jgi:TPR repeat protein
MAEAYALGKGVARDRKKADEYTMRADGQFQ